MLCYRVLDLEKKKEAVQSVLTKSISDNTVEESSGEDDDFDEFLDWRAKKAFKLGLTCCWEPQQVLILQKKAIRILADLEPQQSCRQTFQALGIKTITALYIQEVILHAHSLSLQTGKDFHSYNTRHTTNYVLPPHRTAIFEEKPSYIGRKLWNALPDTMKGLKRKTA
ncbi:hypothetical protein J6590_026666 [Homalodisca vitripennis]|nr:hypothetical protein J6590_026666 [Homalodisca vitripennis]